MDHLGFWQILFCALVLTTSFAIRGGAGFGGAAVGVPLLALVLPLPVVVPMFALLNTLTSIGHGVHGWRNVRWIEVARIVPFTLVGVAIGLYLLSRLDADPLRKGLGVFVIVYALYTWLITEQKFDLPRRLMLPLAASAGFIAGIVSTLFGAAAGPIYVVYLNMLRLAKDQFRVTITMIMLFQGFARVGGYLSMGFYDAVVLKLLVLALPLMLLGSWLGVRVVRRIDQRLFTRLIAVVLLISGTALILK